MKHENDAIAIANYFIDKARVDEKGITLLFLVKLVYIAHGYLSALLEHGGFNPMFDKVEAWKIGPIIPSVYHTFIYNENKPITEKGVVLNLKKSDTLDNLHFIAPKVKDEDEKNVLDFVWKRYGKRTPTELVTLTHRDDTPWKCCYEEGKNNPIPDELIKNYYKLIIEKIIKN